MLPKCTATFFSLSLSLQPTPMTTTTTTAAAAATAAFFFQPKTSLFKYYHHYTLITLSHSLRLGPLLLHTHATRSSFLSPTHETKISLHRGKIFSFPSTQLATLLFFFQISRRHCHFQISIKKQSAYLQFVNF